MADNYSWPLPKTWLQEMARALAVLILSICVRWVTWILQKTKLFCLIRPHIPVLFWMADALCFFLVFTYQIWRLGKLRQKVVHVIDLTWKSPVSGWPPLRSRICGWWSIRCRIAPIHLFGWARSASCNPWNVCPSIGQFPESNIHTNQPLLLLYLTIIILIVMLLFSLLSSR